MLAHDSDNCPVGGADSARLVTTAVIVLCLMLMSPGLRGRVCQPSLSVPRIVADGQAHRALSKRLVTQRAGGKTSGGRVG